MKTTTVHQWDGILLSLFQMDAGDKIERHSHPFQHTTGVARGSTRVTLFDTPIEDAVFLMVPGYKDFAFPPNVEHEIEALEDGTIVVNLSHVADQGEPGKPGEDGGIAYDS
jgi:quercetin dioxygenase-like cupin family protein